MFIYFYFPVYTYMYACMYMYVYKHMWVYMCVCGICEWILILLKKVCIYNLLKLKMKTSSE